MDIKVLGMGCQRCRMLEQMTYNAVSELRIEADISKVEDFEKIAEYGVLSTPGLVINGNLVLSGRLPSFEELIRILAENK